MSPVATAFDTADRARKPAHGRTEHVVERLTVEVAGVSRREGHAVHERVSLWAAQSLPGILDQAFTRAGCTHPGILRIERLELSAEFGRLAELELSLCRGLERALPRELEQARLRAEANPEHAGARNPADASQEVSRQGLGAFHQLPAPQAGASSWTQWTEAWGRLPPPSRLIPPAPGPETAGGWRAELQQLALFLATGLHVRSRATDSTARSATAAHLGSRLATPTTETGTGTQPRPGPAPRWDAELLTADLLRSHPGALCAVLAVLLRSPQALLRLIRQLGTPIRHRLWARMLPEHLPSLRVWNESLAPGLDASGSQPTLAPTETSAEDFEQWVVARAVGGGEAPMSEARAKRFWRQWLSQASPRATAHLARRSPPRTGVATPNSTARDEPEVYLRRALWTQYSKLQRAGRASKRTAPAQAGPHPRPAAPADRTAADIEPAAASRNRREGAESAEGAGQSSLPPPNPEARTVSFELLAAAASTPKEALHTISTPEQLFTAPRSVPCAGLVLLWPFLPEFFRLAGVSPGADAKEATRQRAVQLLHSAATGAAEAPEQELWVAKLLCGWPLEQPVRRYFTPQPEERQQVTELLAAAIDNWGSLGSTSVEGLRSSFLQREGTLAFDRQWPLLSIQRGPYDMLLDRLPWSLSMIKLSWMLEPLAVQW